VRLKKKIKGLLVAATTKEIDPFLHFYKQPSSGLGTWELLITGPGLTATTYHLTKYLAYNKPPLVVMAGIAGCFDPQFPLGTVVAIKKDRVADEGVFEEGQLKTLVEMGLVKKDQFPFRNGWLQNNSELLSTIHLKKVSSITVNQVTATKKNAAIYSKTFQAVTESMEGAALHYICLMEQIPFLQLRAISNYVGERNKKKWNFANAIGNLNNELMNLLKKL